MAMLRRIVYCLFLVALGLLSCCVSTVAFVTATISCKNCWAVTQKLFSEASGGNLVWLQKRFNCTDDWTKRKSHLDLDTLNQSIVDSRIEWLKERLNLNEDEVATIIKNSPRILNLRSDEKLGPTVDFLQEQVMLKPNELSKLIKRQPSILNYRIEKLQQNYNWIEMRIVSNIPNKSLIQKKDVMKKLIWTNPFLLAVNIDKNLDPNWNMLKDRLDLNETQLAKISIRNPSFISCNFTTSIEPKLNWLQNNLNLDLDELRRIIQKQPTLLTSSIENSFEPRLSWLQTRLSFDESIIKKIVLWHPPILSYSIVTKMEPTLQWLEKRLAVSDSCQRSRIIEKYPSLFGMSIENNLEPTVDFFCECLGEEEVVKVLQNNPSFLGASLEKRLKPRRKEAQQAGIDIDIQCLQRMATYNDQKWYINLNK